MLGIADLKVDLVILLSHPSLLRFFASQICNEISRQIIYLFLKFLFGDCALRLGFEMEAKNKLKIEDSTTESPTSVLEDKVCSSVLVFLPRMMIIVFKE